MSNQLAIGAATAALQRLVQKALDEDFPGAKVSTDRPKATPANKPAGVNVWLYGAAPNAALRNADLPTRSANGNATARPRAAFDLHYLLTFYGDDSKLEPQRLLGISLRTLHAHPVLDRGLIGEVVTAANAASSPEHPYLKTTDLGEESELVKLTPANLNIDEI